MTLNLVGDQWLRYRWENEHAPDCPITGYRADLLKQLARLAPTDGDYSVLAGAVPEYQPDGDQEADLCECGAAVGLTPEQAAALERVRGAWGNDPQAVGAADGDEDDFGDLVSETLDALGRDPDAPGGEAAFQRALTAATSSGARTLLGFAADLDRAWTA